MDHNQNKIPEGVLEPCPKEGLSAAEFKGATEENQHEQLNINSLSRTEIKGDMEGRQGVLLQDVRMLGGATGEGTGGTQGTSQNVKPPDQAMGEEGTGRNQGISQYVKLPGGGTGDGTEENHNMSHDVKVPGGAAGEGTGGNHKISHDVKLPGRATGEGIGGNHGISHDVMLPSGASGEYRGRNQGMSQYIRLPGGATGEESTRGNQGALQNVKKLSKAVLEEDTKEMSVEEDTYDKQSVRQIGKAFEKSTNTVHKDEYVIQKAKRYFRATFKGNKMPQLIELFNRASLKDDIEENTNEHQNFLNEIPMEKWTKSNGSLFF